MSTFTLAISCLTTSNLPRFMDLTSPGSYAVLLFTASDLASITSHISNWVLFLLCFRLFILSGVISPLISSSVLGTYRPGAFIFQCPIFLPFHSVHGVLKATVVCHSLLQWTTFCQNSPPWPVRLGWPHTAWLSFVELDKAVVRVIRLASCLWLWFLSVCPLSAPTALLGFLLPWMWGSSSQLLLTLDVG